MPRTSIIPTLPSASVPQWFSGLAGLLALLVAAGGLAAWGVHADTAVRKVAPLEQKLDRHIAQEEKERSDLLRSIETSLSTMKQDLSSVKTDLSWLKRNR